jgi:hypothetical protein
MEQLVESKPEIAMSHSGVLYLLEDMGVKLPRPRHGGNHNNSENARAGVSEGKRSPVGTLQKAPHTLVTTSISVPPLPARKVAPMAPPPRPVRPKQSTHPVQMQRRLEASTPADPARSIPFTDTLLHRNVGDHVHLGHTKPTRTPTAFTGLLQYDPCKHDLLVRKQLKTQQIENVHGKVPDSEGERADCGKD